MSAPDREDRAATTRPRLKLGDHLVPGLAALALFVVLAAVFVQAEFGEAAGFPSDVSITASIGYAMFNVAEPAEIPGEGMLVPFEIIDLVLVAALAGAVMLARTGTGTRVVAALTDGGREVRDRLRGRDGGEE